MELRPSHDRFEFTPEQLELLRAQGETPLHVEVKETKKIYLVVEEGVIPTLDQKYIRQGLAHAAQQVEQGDVSEWDPDEIKAAGRELLTRRKQDS
jgi:hypothetical protein